MRWFARLKRSATNAAMQNSWMLLLACCAFALLGYHPYAEDGGIYAAAISARMDASLFPADRPWVLAHTAHSLFVPAVAMLCRVSRSSLATFLPMVQWLTLWAWLAVGLRLARLCFAEARHAPWAVCWLAAMAAVPVAGTSLYLVDPCVTARSVSTPLLLLALVYAVEQRYTRCVAVWALAASLHPLMAVWGGLPLVCLWLLQRRAACRVYALLIAGVPGFGVVVCLLNPDTPAVHAVALTRGYWFLAEWRWYEWVGAVLPFTLLEIFGRVSWLREGWSAEGRRLARAVTLASGFALLVAMLFARVPGGSTLMARTQPMRTLHGCYAVFLLLFAGACLCALEHAGRHGISRWARRAVSAGMIGSAGICLLAMQQNLYSTSGHVESPWLPPRNGWEQAFVWAKEHTSADAVFALDGRYTTLPGEDAQGFRAVALRSALPDEAKDAGVAAVVPGLAAEWVLQHGATAGLERVSDAERRSRLRPRGVSWLVLSAGAVTELECPYRNGLAKVCRL